jgi:hypothetical protein
VTPTLTNATTAAITKSYWVSISNGTCESTRTKVDVTINPLPTLALTAPSQCTGTNLTVTATPSPAGTYTYAWTVPATATAQTSATFGTTVAGVYSVVAKNTTTTCESATTPITVSFKSQPTAPTLTNEGDVCSGSTGKFTITGTSGDIVSYSGTIGTPASPVTIPASGKIDVTVSNVTSNTTITLTKVDNGSCSKVISVASTINVKSIPVLTPPAAISKCATESVTPAVFVSTPTGVTFAWTNTNVSVGLAASGTGNITAYTAPANATGVDIEGTVSVTPTLDGCPGLAKTFKITIKPTPTLSTLTNLTPCKGDVVAASVFSATPSGSTYAWTNSNTGVGLGSASGTGNTPSFTATNTTSSAITSTIEVEPTLNGCKGAKKQYTITVNPDIQLDLQCGMSTPNSVEFKWNALTPPATGYTATYTKNGTAWTGATAPAVGDLSKDIIGLLDGDRIEMTLTPTGVSCAKPITTLCVTTN